MAIPAQERRLRLHAPYYEVIDTKAPLEVWRLPVTEEYKPFFHKMATLCKKYEINCIYSHSTVFHKTAESNRPFISNLGNMVEGAGISIPYKMPIMVPDEEIGNTINHIRPQYRENYSKLIHDIFSPFLR